MTQPATKKKIAAKINHFLKFQAQAAIKTVISSPTCPLSRFLDNLKSDLRCPIIGSMAARLLHSCNSLINCNGLKKPGHKNSLIIKT